VRDVEVTVSGLAHPEIEELDGRGLLIRAEPDGGPWELTVAPRR